MTNTEQPQIYKILELHTKCVYSDPDFILRAQKLKEFVSNRADNHVYGIRTEGKLRLLIGDIDTKRMPDWFIEEVESLEKDFGIDFFNVLGYLNKEGPHFGGDVSISMKSIFEEGPNFLTINIGRNATKNDVMHSLSDFNLLMQRAYGDNRVKKKKLPVNYNLVYAIFKARKRNTTFAEIFKNYQAGELELYNGSTNLNSVEMLKKYYYKYKLVTT